ncbi:diaminobutyrate acetyltransferase [Ectothiorhodospiraceae bacterium BW-2]|nr:diaminobutyrate acetyltransferase [Ectothiorhodospiraceae bacterium BW-2]
MPHQSNLLFRHPLADEGLIITNLIAANPPLDSNSIYSYYLLCRHFANSCVVAETAGEIGGFISAYPLPTRPKTLFVWQVVVAPNLRGQRIARRMLDWLLQQPMLRHITQIEATVNPNNIASRKIFEGVAHDQGTAIDEELFLPATAFGSDASHESEILLRVTLKI